MSNAVNLANHPRLVRTFEENPLLPPSFTRVILTTSVTVNSFLFKEDTFCRQHGFRNSQVIKIQKAVRYSTTTDTSTARPLY